MIIVLEGPDKAGKTTTAQTLQTQWDKTHTTVMMRRGPIVHDPMTEYVSPLQGMIDDHTVFILDRWHVGEMMYGPMLRGKSRLDIPQAMYIDMVMQTLGTHFLHITAPINVLMDRWDKNPDLLIKKEWLWELAIMYDRWTINAPHWVNHNEQLTCLPRPSLSPMAGPYIGPRKPCVLLIGDRRGHDEFIFPFVPRPATSGYWLMRSLQRVGAPVMEIGIVNGNELSTNDLISLWGQLGEPPVVTLGNTANRAWRRTEGGYSNQIPHPQYMRRFRNKDLEEYGNLILTAMKG